MLLRHAALDVYTFPADQVPPCNDQIFFELASDVDWVALAALFQVYWLTTRMGRRIMGGQTAGIAMMYMGDWFEVGRGTVAVYRWWRSESLSRATTLPLPLYRPWQPESINTNRMKTSTRQREWRGPAALSTRADLWPIVGVTGRRKDALVIKIVGETERARGIITLIQSLSWPRRVLLVESFGPRPLFYNSIHFFLRETPLFIYTYTYNTTPPICVVFSPATSMLAPTTNYHSQ
jgi:hypothetical protein